MLAQTNWIGSALYLVLHPNREKKPKTLVIIVLGGSITKEMKGDGSETEESKATGVEDDDARGRGSKSEHQ